MASNRKLIIIISGIIVASSTTYLIYNRIRKKAIIKRIEDAIKDVENPESAIGDESDIQYSKAFDPKYYKTVSTILIKDVTLTDIVKNIYKSLDGWNKNDKLLIEFDKFKNKAQVSQASEKFASLYKIQLRQYLIDQLYDPSKIGSFTLTPNDVKTLQKIQNTVNNLPNK
jgi:hypothetical protein